MSSFIPSAKHFNSVESAIVTITGYSNDSLCHAMSKHFGFSDLAYIPRKEKIQKWVDTLRDLTVMCVSLQYKHHYEGVLDEEIGTQMKYVREATPIRSLSKLDLFKAICCIDYQIEIEHLKDLRPLTDYETWAMESIDKVKNMIARDVVYNLPEYDKANWEIF